MYDFEAPLNIAPVSEFLKPIKSSEVEKILYYPNSCKVRKIDPDADKGGRPRKWFLPLTRMKVPAKYAAALIEIALEWQENEDLSQSTDDFPF